MNALQAFLESRKFESFIGVVIVLNAAVLGFETMPAIADVHGELLHLADRAMLAFFVVELVARLVVYRQRFFRDPWRNFDLAVIGISLLPATGGLAVLRAFRILRVLRLIGFVPSMRRVVGGLFAAIPGMGSILLLLCLVFYVFSVMAAKLYGERFPEFFGGIGGAAFTLFQIMTFESWAMGVVRPVMEAYPYAWIFFIPFILATSFTVLNLFIGVIVSAMQAEHDGKQQAAAAAAEPGPAAPSMADVALDPQLILDELRALRRELESLRIAREPIGGD